VTESATYVGRHSAPASEAATPPADHHGNQPAGPPGSPAWAPPVDQPAGAPAWAPPVDQPAGAPAWAPPVDQPAGAPAWAPPFDVLPATPPRSGLFGSRNRVIAVVGGAAAVLVLAGGGITAGVGAVAKSELCGMLGSRDKMFSVANEADDANARLEAVAKRVHTLSGRLVFSGELSEAGEGLADGLDSMATLLRAGHEDIDDVDASTAAQMNAVAFSVIDNLGRAQRACGLPVTGRLPE
jgi:hypothetical protein